ncbi:MAG: hypothetical protein PHS41_08850 [Victivallaceae bacterium]|nr:hypothetical protein [Victivallaceae bacterium]
MDFLKRHFEKLILLLLLVLFALLLLYLVNIIQSTGEVKDSDLRIPTREADYQTIAETNPKFDFKALFADGSDWAAATPRNQANAGFFSDLVTVFKIVRCPHCGKLIPDFFLNKLPCPLCKKELLKPQKPEKSAETVLQGFDSDKDGIPDAVEERYGLKIDDAADGIYDLDKDGFSNVYEHLSGTDMSKPMSHPPYYELLVLEKLQRDELDIMLRGVVANAGNQKFWYGNFYSPSRRKDNSYYIGDTLKVGSREYVLRKIEPRKKARAIGEASSVNDDTSVVVLEDRSNGDLIKLTVNEKVFAPRSKAVLMDLRDGNKTYLVDVGAEVKLGAAISGYETYRITAIDPVKMVVSGVVIDGAVKPEKRKFQVGQAPIVPEKYRVVVAPPPSAEEGMPGGANDGLPGMPPMPGRTSRIPVR